MQDIIKTMQDSGNKLLMTEAADVKKWQKLRHNKEDIELFLNNAVAQLQFYGKDKKMHDIVCTSNTTLIKTLSLAEADDKAKTSKLKSTGIHTKNADSIMTWDLIDRKMKTVSLKSWNIVNFIIITEDNLLILDQTVNDILKK